jgi:hypothetical protein
MPVDRYAIHITYPEAKMEASRRRLEATRHFEYIDRVPVVLGVYTRYLLDQRGVGYNEYLSSPRANLLHQLQNYKWLLEHVEEDRCTSTDIVLGPDFENVPNASAFGAPIAYRNDEPPRALPYLKAAEDMERVPEAPPQDGLWGECIAWALEWRRLLLQDEVQVYFNGKRAQVRVSTGAYALGPFSTAVDLAGERFYEWLYTAPEACHRLLVKITQAMIRMETYCREHVAEERTGGFGIAEDSAQIISVKQFREFVVPYCRQLYEAFPGERLMHMCGTSQHLLESLRDDLHITSFFGFGSPVDPALVARHLGGHALLQGNIDCVLLREGPEERIIEAVWSTLEKLAPVGGYILCDGCNIVPGTPVEHLNLMVRTAERFGVPARRASS